MKTNELMIGDWVNLSKGNWSKNRQVDIIDIEMIAESVYLTEPIPLTLEILEKNGFEVQDQGGGRKDVWTGFGIDCEGDIEVEFQHNIPTHLKIDGVFKGEYYTSTNIKYVHLLQHALKLCGINREIII